MQKSIHDILQQAGHAKGISKKEVLTIIALKNDDIMKDFEKTLLRYLEKGIIPENIKKEAIQDLERASKNLKNIEKKYQSTIANAYEQAFNESSEIYIREKKQKLQRLEQEMHTLLSL